MKNQDISFWESKESISSYVIDEPKLSDPELLFIFKAVSQIKKPISKIKILDLGCGGGRTTIPLVRMGFEVVGIDISDNLLRPLRKKIPHSQIILGDAAKIPFNDNYFDIVLFSHNSIDYLTPYKQRKKAYQEIARVLKKNGFFIFSSHIFHYIPYNFEVFRNIIINFNYLYRLRTKGYYNERMTNGQNVLTFSASVPFIKKELKANNFLLLEDNNLHIQSSNLLLTLIRSYLSWEKYYLAQKIK